MRRPTLLLAAAGVLALLAVVAAVSIPGALAERDEPVRPAHIDLRDATVKAGAVTGETVTLHVENRLRHRGGPARNVTVVVRAIDAESGMLAATSRTELETLEEAREYNATTAISVPREGGYDLHTILYVGGERRASAGRQVAGVGTLIPDYARTDVTFGYGPAIRTSIPPILYTVDDVSAGRATLEVTPSLTNAGDEPSRSLELVLLARQADSNIVADRASVRVDELEPGSSASPSLELTVPDDYNYHLDAMLRRDGVVVRATSVAASLDPTETVPTNTTTREVGLRTSDFEQEPSRGGSAEPTRTTPGAGGPGFGVGVALAALIAIGALAWRFDR